MAVEICVQQNKVMDILNSVFTYRRLMLNTSMEV